MKVTHKNVFKKTGPAITLWTEADLEEYARLREEEKVQMGGEDRQQSLEKARQMTVDPEAIAKAMGKQTEAVESYIGRGRENRIEIRKNIFLTLHVTPQHTTTRHPTTRHVTPQHGTTRHCPNSIFPYVCYLALHDTTLHRTSRYNTSRNVTSLFSVFCSFA
jgi:hypothetical protein